LPERLKNQSVSMWRQPKPEGRKSDSGSGMSDTDAEKGSAHRHAEAYRKGYLAGRRGCTGADNPYEYHSREARAWIMSLFNGRHRQLAVVSDEKS
jgi:hypothetical protein